jgi:hypothetical protein
VVSRAAGLRRRDGRATRVSGVAPSWIWLQVVIAAFVLAGMVIAIVKLA